MLLLLLKASRGCRVKLISCSLYMANNCFFHLVVSGDNVERDSKGGSELEYACTYIVYTYLAIVPYHPPYVAPQYDDAENSNTLHYFSLAPPTYLPFTLPYIPFNYFPLYTFLHPTLFFLFIYLIYYSLVFLCPGLLFLLLISHVILLTLTSVNHPLIGP